VSTGIARNLHAQNSNKELAVRWLGRLISKIYIALNLAYPKERDYPSPNEYCWSDLSDGAAIIDGW
jgi:hypothetical protein